jgi:hypothetical protein
MPEDPHPIVPGISMSDDGEVTVDPELDDVLCDLADALQEGRSMPLDVEHVVMAVAFAVRNGAISPKRHLRADDAKLREILGPFVDLVFERYGGQVREE